MGFYRSSQHDASDLMAETAQMAAWTEFCSRGERPVWADALILTPKGDNFFGDPAIDSGLPGEDVVEMNQ
jgi:hypothetical protein